MPILYNSQGQKVLLIYYHNAHQNAICRYDTSAPVNDYRTGKKARTLSTIMEWVDSDTNYGVLHEPLIKIDTQQV